MTIIDLLAPAPIPADAETRWAPWAEDGLPTEIARRLTAAGSHSSAEAALVERFAADLDARMAALPIGTAVSRFLDEATGRPERLERRAALRTLELLSGLVVAPLVWPVWAGSIDDPHRRKRPLLPLEMGLVRLVAMQHDEWAAVVAVAELPARSCELLVPAANFAVDNGGIAVHLPGGRWVRPRTRRLPAWAVAATTRLVGARPNAPHLLYRGRSTREPAIESSVLMTIGRVLHNAGLADDRTVAPMSICNTGSRIVYEQAGLEAAVEAAGVPHHKVGCLLEDMGVVPQRTPELRR